MTPTPSDMPHQALRAVRHHTDAEEAAISTSLAEVTHVFEYWCHDYGIEDISAAVELTRITLENITETE